MKRKWKVYWCMPKDLPPGRYSCVLKISNNGKKRLFVLEEKEQEGELKSL